MKRINQAKISLFDSKMAQFRLTIEAKFTRGRPDGSISNQVYITDKGIANLTPNIYLVFGYKGETFEMSKNLYTSYPQLYEIRKIFQITKDRLDSGDAFDTIDGVLAVKPQYQEAAVLSEVGKENRWMSLTLAAVDSTNDSVSNKVPGVAIQLSDSEYASVLTADEFYSLYTTIQTIDLVALQLQMATLFLLSEDGGAGQPMYVNQPPMYQAPPMQQQPQRNYYQQPQQTQQSYQRPQRQVQPQYNNQPVQQPTRTQPQPQPNPAPVQPQPSQDQNSALPPRNQQKPIVNMKAVEETPVSQVNFNDDSAIDAIFNDEE